MSVKEKYGSGLWAFGQVVDRFNPRGYKVSPTTEQLELATKVKALRGLSCTIRQISKETRLRKLRRSLRGSMFTQSWGKSVNIKCLKSYAN
jgi:hypothetical protein